MIKVKGGDRLRVMAVNMGRSGQIKLYDMLEVELINPELISVGRSGNDRNRIIGI